jgi:hypothetical protein
VADARDEPLVAELRDLGRHLDVPPAPDLRAAVRARLATPAPRRTPRRHLRRWLAAAAAALIGVIAVVPPARAAVLDAVDGLLRFAGVEIRSDPGPHTLPVSPSPLPSIRSAALDEARRLAPFPVRVPERLGTPEEVTVADPDADGKPRVVTLTWRSGTVRLDQFNGRLDVGFLKQAGDAQWVNVRRGGGVWFPGPHAVTYVDRTGTPQLATARLAGPTLIWEYASVTYRLEGASLDEALAIAESMP